MTPEVCFFSMHRSLRSQSASSFRLRVSSKCDPDERSRANNSAETIGGVEPKGKHMKKAATRVASQQPPDDQIDLSDMPEIKDWSGATRGMISRPELRLISIRLPAHDLAMANQLAFRKGMPYQTYIKSLLHESLVKEYRKAE
jgi:predicted DNA binding CopG/RHH family protein